MGWSFYTSGGVEVTSAALGSEFPVGTIIDYGGGAAPTNWLLCDGSAVSRTTYNQLFDVIGTAYGAGNGSTTFNLPDSTGQIIYFKRGPAAFTYATTAPTFVTNLPSSPVDGQEIYYQADATNGVIWHLRYRTGSASSYKWEFVGGSSLSAVAGSRSWGTRQTYNSLTYGDLATVGPSIVVPLGGDYRCEIKANCVTNTTSGNIRLWATGDPTYSWSDDTDLQFFQGNQSGQAIVTRTGLSAGNTLKMSYAVSNAGVNAEFWNRQMTVVPVRVG